MLATLLSTVASAQLSPRERYEENLIQAALKRHDLSLELNPAGKKIEQILIDASEVILPGDLSLLKPVPVLSRYTLFNFLHVRTRHQVIARELLFRVGETFRPELIAESGRNLRSMFILSIARLVVVKGSHPDTVKILVVTKDQWSLRLNTEFTLDQARLDRLSFSISESNLAGRNKTFSVNFALDPGRYTVGLGYSDPRIWASRHYMTIGAGIYLDRADSHVEGFSVSAATGRSLYSLKTKWSWGASAGAVHSVVRLFRGGRLAGLRFNDEGGAVIIPNVYNARSYSGAIGGTRSFGVVNKLNLTANLSISSSRYAVPDDVFVFKDGKAEPISDKARAAFQRTLPRSEDAFGPSLGLSAFRAEYITLQNIETFALTEDFRIGPTASASVTYAIPVFPSSHYLSLAASYGAAHYFHGDLFSYSFGAAARIQPGVLQGTSLINEEISASVANVSPLIGPFRLHVKGLIRLRNHDTKQIKFELGSSTGLRGFAPREFIGNNVYLVNVELRTLPINLWTVHVGAVLFYDGGDTPANLNSFGYHQDIGVGLRILLPQFNRDVLRLDLAFPCGEAVCGYAPRFSAEFGQAF